MSLEFIFFDFFQEIMNQFLFELVDLYMVS